MENLCYVEQGLLISPSGRKPTLFSFKYLSKVFGGNDFRTFIKSIYCDLRAPSFLAEQNREGGDAGSRAGRRPAPLAASSTEREC